MKIKFPFTKPEKPTYKEEHILRAVAEIRNARFCTNFSFMLVFQFKAKMHVSTLTSHCKQKLNLNEPILHSKPKTRFHINFATSVFPLYGATGL